MKDELQPIKWIEIDKIKINPKNRNKHPKEQIADIAKSIQRYGFRDHLIIGMESETLISGHGTLQAAKKLGLKKVPVMYQSFKSPELEYGFGVAINELRKKSQLDLAGIHADLPDLDPSKFNIEDLFVDNFEFEPDPGKEPSKMKAITCPKCGEVFEKGQAKSKAL